METDGKQPFHWISEEEWKEGERFHRGRLEPIVTPSLERRARRIHHPIYDFLFTYFSFPSAKLLRWNPGIGVGVRLDCGGAGLPGYMSRQPYVRNEHGYTLDVSRLSPKLLSRAEWIVQLCSNLMTRAGNFGCFGLHEWAMVYGAESADAVRHAGVPLRLTPSEIADVVDSQPLRCTHFDAFRFFTAPARPLNAFLPHFDTRLEMEQPGCIHTNMDLYKWSYKLSPWCGSELVADAFLLAAKAREVDMRASPYDLAEFGFTPIKIETAAGRDEYVACQTAIAKEARPVREKLLDRARAILESAARPTAAP